MNPEFSRGLARVFRPLRFSNLRASPEGNYVLSIHKNAVGFQHFISREGANGNVSYI
jgi:hypothetical protein